MPPRWTVLAVAFLGLTASFLLELQGAGDGEKKEAAPSIKLPQVCDTPLQAPKVSWRLWEDVEGRLQQKNHNVVQRATDLFAWQDFIAINWPAADGQRGAPDQTKPFTAPGLRVWETWKETSEVYLPDGAKPADWNAPEPLPADLKDRPRAKFLFRQNKVDEALRDDIQPTNADGALPGTLTDQRGQVVRYEIRMNKVLFDYVVANKFYDARIQAKAAVVRVPDGSILIKAAWREVTPEKAGRFYTAPAYVADHPDRRQAKYQLRTVGLVGLHIMHKTASAPQWIWSTFEQVDNVGGAQPSFHDPRQVQGPVNKQTKTGIPNQVTRVIPIPDQDPDCAKVDQAVDNVCQLNRDMQKGLGTSVFRHYELVGAQWPVPTKRDNGVPATVFTVLPELLGNTTMETFIQGTSSCMGCHAMARSTNHGRFVSADFTFTFGDALPKLPHPRLNPPPAKPQPDVQKERWATIQRGHALATRTYELLPEVLPNSKLHCQSCHLHGGGDPNASWWVGMTAKYQYPKTDLLAVRINQCFEQSMNGKPLCAPSNKTNPHMNALIVYMQWLDEQAQSRNIPAPASPFPSVEQLTGNRERGAKVFLQKCAFCHGQEGQGRYESDTYYRPALWGKHSYNASAGMAKPATLAAFLHGNMPYGSGGELTSQEAWDLATFIDAQNRPQKQGK